MRSIPSLATLRLAAAATMMAGLLAACDKPPASPAPEATPTPEAAAPSPAGDAPAPGLPPEQSTTPESSPADPAQPAPDAPPPTEPSPAAKPTSTAEPALESMKLASGNAKIGVPVDLRYSFDGDALSGQPVTLHLAAVPRVAGTNLEVSLKAVEGLESSVGTLSVQKATAATPYRRQYAVTRQPSGPTEIRVLVTMGVGQGSAFSWFSIPLDGGISAGKQDSVKRH
jgi:hypothetical protein